MGRTARFLLVITVALAGCGSRPRIVIASKNFTEQVILGEVIAQQIERRLDITVGRKLNLGGTLLAHQALKGGSIDLYPEYTGTALTAVLKRPISNDPAAVLASVRDGYRQWNVTWLDPLGFDNTFAMVVRSETGLHTVSEAAVRSQHWKLGAGYEFVERADGLPGLVKTYGLRLEGAPIAMDLGLLYSALEKRQVDMAAASATDGMLARKEFTMLTDDKRYFPPYECAIVVRDDALAREPKLRAALTELSGRITPDIMRRLNAAVDRDKRSVVDVAAEFLK